MKKKITAIRNVVPFVVFIICAFVMYGTQTVYAANVVDSGTCGDNVTWTYTDDGVLTISGTGEMDYSGKNSTGYIVSEGVSYCMTPWSDYHSVITKIVIEDGVTSIAYGAFMGHLALTDITIANSVETIDDRAFAECISLTEICIPDSVTSIGFEAFEYCTSLVSITMSKNIEKISANAFRNTGYYNDENNWKSCVLYIENALIEADTSIRDDYTVKDGTTCIASYAFMFCSDLTEITFPDSVIHIGFYIFDHCQSLSSITLGNGITVIGDWLSGLTSLKTVILGNSVTEISEKAFKDCERLTEIVIPASVVSIGDKAFYNCTNLSEIYFRGENPEIGTSAFYNVKATGYYPETGSWTEDDFVDHGGSITWVAYDASIYVEEENTSYDDTVAPVTSDTAEDVNETSVNNNNDQTKESTGLLAKIIEFFKNLFGNK